MKITIHQHNGQKVAEAESESIILKTAQDALDLMVNPGLEGTRKVIVHKESVAPEFFELRTGLAGEILQKFVTYQVQLAIVGDFTGVTSESLKAFIIESNRGGHVAFLPTVEEAVAWLSGR